MATDDPFSDIPVTGGATATADPFSDIPITGKPAADFGPFNDIPNSSPAAQASQADSSTASPTTPNYALTSGDGSEFSQQFADPTVQARYADLSKRKWSATEAAANPLNPAEEKELRQMQKASGGNDFLKGTLLDPANANIGDPAMQARAGVMEINSGVSTGSLSASPLINAVHAVAISATGADEPQFEVDDKGNVSTSIDPEAQRIYDEAGKPVVTLPKPTANTIPAGIVRGLATTAEGLTTPTNLALLATLDAAPAVVTRVAAAGFAAAMAKDLPEQIKAIGAAQTSGDKAQKITEAIASAAMIVLSAKHAAEGEPSSAADNAASMQDAVLQAKELLANGDSEGAEAALKKGFSDATMRTAAMDSLQDKNAVSGASIEALQSALTDPEFKKSLPYDPRLIEDELDHREALANAKALSETGSPLTAAATLQAHEQSKSSSPAPGDALNSEHAGPELRNAEDGRQGNGGAGRAADGQGSASGEGDAGRVHVDSAGGAVGEGISVGPGAASAAEDISNTQQPTSLKRAVVDLQRTIEGREDIPVPERAGSTKLVSDAEDAITNNPDIGRQTVDRILDNSASDQQASPKDAAVMLVERTRLRNERAANEERAVDPNATQQERDDARYDLSGIEDRIDKLDQASRSAGTAWSDFGRLYQQVMKDDYSLESLERKAIAAKAKPGESMTRAEFKDQFPKEHAQLQEQAKRIAELEKDAAAKKEAFTKETTDAEVQRTHDATVAEVAKEGAQDANGQKIEPRIMAIAEKIVKGLENQADAALSRIRARRAEGRVNSLPVDDLIDYSIYGAAKIARKGLDFTKWSAEMVKDIGDMSADVLKQVWDASNARIDELGKKNGKDADKVTAAIRKKAPQTPVEAKAAAKAEAVAGEPLSHKTVFDYVKSLIQSGVHGVDPLMKAAHEGLKEHFPGLTERDVRRAYSEYGKVKFPSKEAVARELAETRRITQLQESIDRLNEGKDALHTGLQRDKATQQVREKTKELNELLKKRAGPPSPEKLAGRDEAKQTALKNQIADLDKQLRTGEKPAKGAPIPDSAKTEQLRAERDAMKAKLDEIDAEQNPGKSEAQKQEESLQKQLDDINGKLAGTKEKTAPAEWKALSQKAEDLRAQLDSVRQLKKELEANGGKTNAEKQVDQLSKVKERLNDTLSGKRVENTPKDWTPLSAAAEDLKAEIQGMRELAAQLRRDAKPKTDPAAAKEKAKIAALEKAIKNYEDRLAKSDFSKPPKSGVSDSKRVADLKAIRDARRAAYEAAKDAGKPVRTPEQRYNETRLKQVQKRTAELEAKTKAGDFTKPAKPPAKTKYSDVITAEAKLEKVKREFDAGVEKNRLANRTPSQKFWDHFVGVERAMKLSSDVVLAKLSTAAAVREGFLTPAEEVVGGGISKVLPRLAARAAREGGLNLKAEAKAKAAAFTSGMRDAWDNLRFRKSELENRFGSKKPDNPSWYEYFGYLHGALKAPVKRAEFARSLEKRIYSAQKAGVDVNNIETMGRLAQESYVDAERAIFMQDNAVSEFFNNALSMAEKSKKFPNGGAAIARIGRFLVPIVKVPTNLVGEVATGVHGIATGGIRAATAYVKGIDSLPPEQADAIMRQLKKGFVGNALLLTGYLGYKSIGGFYQSKETRDKSDVEAEHLRVGKVNLPGFTSHSTAGALLNIGATFRRVDDKKKGGGVAAGLSAALRGEVKQLPFVPAATNIVTALESDEAFHKYVRDLVIGSTIPSGVAHVAKIMDTPGTFPANALTPATKRYPRNDTQQVKMVIPGLRSDVPRQKKPTYH